MKEQQETAADAPRLWTREEIEHLIDDRNAAAHAEIARRLAEVERQAAGAGSGPNPKP